MKLKYRKKRQTAHFKGFGLGLGSSYPVSLLITSLLKQSRIPMEN